MKYVAALLLAGCAGSMPTDCPGAHVTLGGDITCDEAHRQWEVAWYAVFLAAGQDADLDHWHVLYRAEHWQDDQGREIAGSTFPSGGVVWIRSDHRCVLTHEMFHMYEWDVLHVSNPTHAGWAERGWFAAVEAVCLGAT